MPKEIAFNNAIYSIVLLSLILRCKCEIKFGVAVVSLQLLNLTPFLRNTSRKAVLVLDIINDNNCSCMILSVDVALAWNLFVSSVRQSFLHENPWPGLLG